jgi:Xaa-Pro aminopeptidase
MWRACCGQATLKALGHDHQAPFGPHLVGLHHTDMPARGADGALYDLALEAGMILSVDRPLMETGHSGSAHLEDLMLITADGAEPIHATGPATLTV